MMKLVILNVHREREDRFDDVCTTETFETTVAEYHDKVRYEAANMAAHNWDVIEIDDQIFIGGPSRGLFYTKDGKESKATEEQMNQFYPIIPADDYRTSSQTVWIGKKSFKRRNEIQLAWHGAAGKRFMMIETIMKQYRYDTRDMNSKRINGEYWDEERRVRNYQARCKKFRLLTEQTVNELIPD